MALPEGFEQTLERKDHDFTQLSIAYTAAIDAGKSRGVQFTAEECGYVENALAECVRLKDAVRLMTQAHEAYINYPGDPDDDEHFELWQAHYDACRAVEELLK